MAGAEPTRRRGGEPFAVAQSSQRGSQQPSAVGLPRARLLMLTLMTCLVSIQPLKAHELLEESTFDTRSQAEAAAQYLGCKGVRQIEYRWKPCDRPFPSNHPDQPH